MSMNKSEYVIGNPSDIKSQSYTVKVRYLDFAHTPQEITKILLGTRTFST